MKQRMKHDCLGCRAWWGYCYLKKKTGLKPWKTIDGKVVGSIPYPLEICPKPRTYEQWRAAISDFEKKNAHGDV